MIVTCKECGKKYKLNSEKIKGETVQFRCKVCDNILTVRKETVTPKEPPQPVYYGKSYSTKTPLEKTPVSQIAGARVKSPHASPTRFKGIGLRGKLMLFLLLPLILALFIKGFLSLKQIQDLTGLFTERSSQIIAEMAEKQIADHGRAVALQVKLFLLNNPELQKEKFNQNKDFKAIAVKKVGLTGYSFLYELPGPDQKWKNWAHVDSDIVGIDMSVLKKSLGKSFQGFWNIFTRVKVVEESMGYYTWLEKDGSLRKKFMACTPVTGTRYIVASTTYLDEFTLPVKRLQRDGLNISKKARSINGFSMLGTIILVALIVFFYGRKITSNIRDLSNVADRISFGDLGAEVKIRSKDEIGELGESIVRMQDSIMISIERLRENR